MRLLQELLPVRICCNFKLNLCTEMSQRRSQRSAAAADEELEPALDGAVTECVRYVLCRESSKIPLKRAEIVKHLNTTFQINSNQVNKIVAEANKILKKVYGYKLVQVDAKSGVHYIVTLTEDCQSVPSMAADPQHRRLLIASLTHIFMSGGSVKEEELWKFLEECGLMEENDHTGRKLLLSTFTKQLYLTYSKVGEGELARHMFEWGQRAIEEVPKMYLLNKMAEAFNKPPDHWYEQYKEASEGTELTAE